MSIHCDRAAIETVLETVRQGLWDKDAAAVGAQFASDARIFDLSPPLAHQLEVPGLAAWLDTWEGPVDTEPRDLVVDVSGELAFCHGLYKVSTKSKTGEDVQWWQRATICLRRIDGAWKIVHEHTSVPFYMDGSFRAAIDLQPGGNP